MLGMPGRATITARMPNSSAALRYSATTNDLFRRDCAMRRLDNTLRTMATFGARRASHDARPIERQMPIVCRPARESQEEPVLVTPPAPTEMMRETQGHTLASTATAAAPMARKNAISRNGNAPAWAGGWGTKEELI